MCVAGLQGPSHFSRDHSVKYVMGFACLPYCLCDVGPETISSEYDLAVLNLSSQGLL